MTMRCPTLSWPGAVLGLALAIMISVPASSRGQNTTDPYNPWNWMYNPYTMPMSPSANPAIPNQARIESMGSGTRAFDESIDGYTGSGGLFGRGGGRFGYSGTGDPEDRVYRPNRDDGDFYRDKQDREARYFEAKKEKDPKKRAEMLKKIQIENRRAALGLDSRKTKKKPKSGASAPLSTRRSETAAGSARGTTATGRGRSASATNGLRSSTTTPGASSTTTRPRGAAATRRPGSSAGVTTNPSDTTAPSAGRDLTPEETLRRAQNFGRTPRSGVPAARRPQLPLPDANAPR